LKNTDAVCNPTTAISSAFSCKLRHTDANHAKSSDFTLYQGQVADRVPPPNVNMTPNMEYSPETVMAEVSRMRNDIQLYQKQLPDTVAVAVQENIRPMVSGILADNYYIQV